MNLENDANQTGYQPVHISRSIRLKVKIDKNIIWWNSNYFVYLITNHTIYEEELIG